MKKKITIRIQEDGSMSVEASGYEHGACLNALKDIEKLFGSHDGEIKMKKEGEHHVTVKDNA